MCIDLDLCTAGSNQSTLPSSKGDASVNSTTSMPYCEASMISLDATIHFDSRFDARELSMSIMDLDRAVTRTVLAAIDDFLINYGSSIHDNIPDIKVPILRQGTTQHQQRDERIFQQQEARRTLALAIERRSLIEISEIKSGSVKINGFIVSALVSGFIFACLKETVVESIKEGYGLTKTHEYIVQFVPHLEKIIMDYVSDMLNGSGPVPFMPENSGYVVAVLPREEGYGLSFHVNKRSRQRTS